MSQTLSSAYAGLAKLLTEAGHFVSPAELQGALWGLVAAGSKQQLLDDLSSLLGEGELTESIKLAISGLQEMMRKELTDGSVTVTLLLPIDDEALKVRLNGVIDWASGFLSGFGMVKQPGQLTKETLEILADLDAITQLETAILAEDEARSEGDYMELVEFLRLVPLLVVTELDNRPQKEQTIH